MHDLVKQLKELKEHCKQIDETNKILYQEKCDLIKENEELTEQLDEEMLKVTQLATEIVELKTYIDRAGIVGIIKVLKCLDEIEGICNDSYCDNTVCANCDYNNIDCDLVRRKAVLQKIKEVKE